MEINRYTLITSGLLFLLLILSRIGDISTHSSTKEVKSIKHSVVKLWAEKLGADLWHLGDFITRRKEVQDSFKSAEIVTKRGKNILEPMAQELKFMFDQKVSAVRRIMESAQNTALTHEKTEIIADLPYYNAKEMLQEGDPHPPNQSNTQLDDRSIKGPYIKPSYIFLNMSQHFFNALVNTSMSSVHIPTNVFDRDNATLWAIQWSEKLDNIFLSNYLEDPTLSWQFYGSATGFMRQFPASKWNSEYSENSENVPPVDLYDCRLRSWYIEAANSPKDIMILVDVSGSMTGQRKDIARHVVYNILDTLGTNDFVNIFEFDEAPRPVVPCFNETLVQATLANIRELKKGLEEIKTDAIANYSAALVLGFEILESFRTAEYGYGARCNQAIMLISDGVPSDFSEVIEKYNLQNNTYKPVRIFTYLIGKEVADVKKIKDMACSNLGYYVHLSTLAEVREQVLNYIPVMARPLVLGGDDHPIIWTQAYADVVDPIMTDWKWEVKEREQQKDVFEQHRNNKNFNSEEEKSKRLRKRQKINFEQQYGTGDYNLVTTVSMPVFDKRKNATYIANLLGVAGTDVPIRDIQKLLSSFELGVNGYAFIVTNNGFVLTHPDLRPVFQGILKPGYNSIDLTEVELLDDNSEPRQFDPALMEFREEIINQTTGSKFLIVKQHLDNMKRIQRLTRLYYWQPIENTPFTLVISYPIKPYGSSRVKVKVEHDIRRLLSSGSDIISAFDGNHWKIHPDWIYCRQIYGRQNNGSFSTPENELLYFLEKIKSPGWKWKDRASHFCDRELMQQLVFDAKATESFSVDKTDKDEKSNKKTSEKGPRALLIRIPRDDLIKMFGLKVKFLATQSGLTRWTYFDNNIEQDQEFSELHNRAIDEVWYKRAIDQHFVEQQSFVFSVPFNEGDEEMKDYAGMKDTLVTASHAIFLTEDKRSAPAGVVGYQFLHSALYSMFKNSTSKCGDSRDSCENELKCFTDDGKDMEAGCYVLDNNGYVIISPNKDETGKFFGEVRGWLLRRLVEENIYQVVTINDYQAVCFPQKTDGSSGSILQIPIVHFIRLFKWLGRVLTWAFVHFTMMTPAYGFANYEDYGSYADASTLDPTDRGAEASAEVNIKIPDESIIKRTRPQPCDQVIKLYTLDPAISTSIYDEPANDCDRPFVVVPIPSSNLILVVFDANGCPAVPDLKESILPQEKDYGNRSLPCYREEMQPRMQRRRPTSCINHHVNESLIDQCGRGFSLTMSVTLIAFLVIIQAAL